MIFTLNRKDKREQVFMNLDKLSVVKSSATELSFVIDGTLMCYGLRGESSLSREHPHLDKQSFDKMTAIITRAIWNKSHEYESLEI